MTTDRSHRDSIGNRRLHPETLMLGYGYDPTLSEGSVKPPVFLTSTFVFASAEDGRDFFDFTSGRRAPPEGRSSGLVYSRFNHPNTEIVEDRLAIFEGAETALLFSSGMAAIAMSLLAYVRPGDIVLHSQPLYGGTETLLSRTMADFGVGAEGFMEGLDAAAIDTAADRAMARGRVSAILIETPSNPLNTMVDFAAVTATASRINERQKLRPVVICDNTLLGPVFQHPLAHGIDIVVYSATKYIGGHSDLIAGAAAGNFGVLKPVRALRSAMGTQLDPHTCWMLGRSLETLSLRMRAAAQGATIVADALVADPHVEQVHALHRLPESSVAQRVFQRQCSGAGSTFSFEVSGGEADAFRLLNALRVFKLAVSLGGTESLASHPASTTHSGVPLDVRHRLGITERTVRLSVGVEHPDDLVADLKQALASLP